MPTKHWIKSKNFWIITISAGFLLISLISILLYRNNHQKQTLHTVSTPGQGTSVYIELDLAAAKQNSFGQ